MNKRKTFFFVFCLWMACMLAIPAIAQEDKMVKIAIDTVKAQGRLPQGMEVIFVEKMESSIPGFTGVKLMLMAPDREVPVIVYVDSTGEKVILGNLFVKGENVTRKEAGEPKARKIDMARFDMEKSPIRGGANAQVTILEFSNFECPYCFRSWTRIKELLEKHPQEIRYVFKHFPLQRQGKPFELSAMVAATQAVSNDAFWLVHDFLFSNEGQAVVKKEKEEIKKKIEELLKEKGHNVQAFQTAFEEGKGKKKVEEDLVVGDKLPVTGTPTTIANGNFVRGPITDQFLNELMGKPPESKKGQ
jgi:protein-disulfide isomerase